MTIHKNVEFWHEAYHTSVHVKRQSTVYSINIKTTLRKEILDWQVDYQFSKPQYLPPCTTEIIGHAAAFKFGDFEFFRT